MYSKPIGDMKPLTVSALKRIPHRGPSMSSVRMNCLMAYMWRHAVPRLAKRQ
jgi:hypothetical protein